MNKNIELAEFLKAKRGSIQPEQVGLAHGSRRRTKGLRREEVADLAGIGLTWYTWLEQGRDIQVSVQVLESIARALMLTFYEKQHLFTLAGKFINDLSSPSPTQVSPSIKNLIENISNIPAYVMDEHWNLLAWNDIAEKVFVDFSALSETERNIVRLMFTSKPYMDLFIDWNFHARGMIARFRADYGKHSSDIRFQSFAEELCKANSTFNELWALHDIQGMNDVVKEINHPKMGRMVFEFVSCDFSAAPNLKLIFHNPIGSTDTLCKIDLLQNSN